MARVGVKGLAVAVVADGRVVLTREYGVRNATGAPLRPDTIMYGASITTPIEHDDRSRARAAGSMDTTSATSPASPPRWPRVRG